MATEAHMTPDNTVRLTPAQRNLLERLAGADYDLLYLRGADLRGVVHPNLRGLIESMGGRGRWYRITLLGKEAINARR